MTMYSADAQSHYELESHRRSTVDVDANGYVCQGDRCVFNIHVASLDAQAKTEISNTRSVSATLGVCTERLRVARLIISARLRYHEGSAPPEL